MRHGMRHVHDGIFSTREHEHVHSTIRWLIKMSIRDLFAEDIEGLDLALERELEAAETMRALLDLFEPDEAICTDFAGPRWAYSSLFIQC